VTEAAATLPRAGRAPEPPRVLVRERIAEAGIELLRRRFAVDVDLDGDLDARIGDYEAIIVRSGTHLTRELIERAERLKVIGRAGVGVDNVDVAAASERGIVVANAPQSTVVSAAEHTVGLLLALSRNIPQAHAAVKEGRWERSRFAGRELAGKTLGLVGFGRIGQQVARRAGGLEMRVVAHDPYVAPERFRSLGVERAASLEDLLRAADFVSLHLTLTSETRGLIGRDELGRARDGVRLVNVARGELVDEDALVEALRSGKVAGAALDVFQEEPYSGPLLELENVIVTPHLGASTAEAQDRAGVIVAEQVAAALEGGVVTNAVNMPAVPAEELEQVRPFLPLASTLGALAVELAGGSPTRIDLMYLGRLAERDTRLLTVAALNGAFKERVEQPVNYVNAPLVARERGIEVREESSAASADYTSLVGVTAHAGGDVYAVAGTTIGREQRPQLVRALGYEIEVELDRLMLFAVNDDTPGMIGRLGTILGEAGVNIANMAVSRNRRAARALMVLSLDTEPPRDVLDRLRSERGFVDARFIVLPEL
jgi:D-3-phosphoglycerate dehydrogenase